MCGRLNIIDDRFVQALMREMKVCNPAELQTGRFKMPTHDISIVREVDGVRQLQTANWWLLQDATAEGFKPSRYTSFNSRFDKLNQKGSASYLPYRHSRCVVVARGFGETQKQQGKSRYFDFIAQDCAIAFAGLFRQWQHPHTGTLMTSCSIITLPPEPNLQPYHSKASPMILPNDNQSLAAWLSPANQSVSDFDSWLQPNLRHSFVGQEITKPSEPMPLGSPFQLGDTQISSQSHQQGRLF